MAAVTALEVGQVLRGLDLQDLRAQCRARGLTPAGSADALRQQLSQHMLGTQNLTLVPRTVAKPGEDSLDTFANMNNYSRPGGNQNLGNHITKRPSSRVLAPPGGKDQVVLGEFPGPTGGTPLHGPTPGTPAHQAATKLLAQMGLGDTDALVAGPDGPGALGSAGPPYPQGPGQQGQASSYQQYGQPQRHGAMQGEYARTPPGPGAWQEDGMHAYRAERAGAPQAFGELQLPSYASQPGPAATPPPNKSGRAIAVQEAVQHLPLSALRTECRARNLSPAGGVEQLRSRLGDHMLATGEVQVQGGAAPSPAPYQPFAGSPAPYTGSTPDHVSNNYARPGGAQNVGNFLTGRNTSRVLAPPGGVSQISFGDYTPPAAAPPTQQAQGHSPMMRGHGAGGAPGMMGPGGGGGAGYRMAPPDGPLSAPPPQFGHGMAMAGGAAGPYGTPQQFGRRATPPTGSPASYIGGSTPEHMSNNYARPGGQQNVGNFITGRPTSRVLAPPGGKSQITFG